MERGVIKLLSLDQATVKTGIAIHSEGELTGYDVVNLEKEKIDIPNRVYVMIDRVCELIHKEQPDCVVFEDVALQSNPATLILLARLQGAIIGCCRENKIVYSIIKPPNWRKALGFKQGSGIKRPQLKKQAAEYVLNKYGLKLGEDVCEAVCIGDAYIKISDEECEV